MKYLFEFFSSRRVFENVEPYGSFLKGTIVKSSEKSEIGHNAIFGPNFLIVEYTNEDEEREKELEQKLGELAFMVGPIRSRRGE